MRNKLLRDVSILLVFLIYAGIYYARKYEISKCTYVKCVYRMLGDVR